jgi:hypothetical protein
VDDLEEAVYIRSFVYRETATIFGTVMLYIYFLIFFFTGPPCAFRGCHVVPPYWATWNPMICQLVH